MTKVSILMSVYNGERFVRQAVESLLNQTCHDFELFIVDDASTDRTHGILEELAAQDSRVMVLTNSTNLGLTKSLNIALRLPLDGFDRLTVVSTSNHKLGVAQGNFVARMDADDIALPQRLEKQVAFLNAHPEVGIVGTWYQFINDAGNGLEEKHPPTDDAQLRRALIRFNPFLHSSTMIRTTVLDQIGGYDESYSRAQDYDLWMRCAPLTKFANLPEILMQKRFTMGMISYAREKEQIRSALRVRLAALRRKQYPWWCSVFLLKPALAVFLPTPVVRFVRIHLFGQHLYKNHS